jgi:hypothetical protein
MNTFGKGTIDSFSVDKRMQLINALGYDVMLMKNGYYTANIEFLRSNRISANTQVDLIMGDDTYERINYDEVATLKNSGAQLHVVGRK